MVYAAVAERLSLDKDALERFEESLVEPDPVSDRARRVAFFQQFGGEVVEVT